MGQPPGLSNFTRHFVERELAAFIHVDVVGNGDETAAAEDGQQDDREADGKASAEATNARSR